jgi:hypothetical protein
MTVGRHWNQVDRTKMQEYMHAAKHGMKEEDVPYLLDLFNRTPDPAFRWWFSWLAQQAPDPRFVEPLTEVYRIDPNRAIQAMAVISGPAARDRYLKLFEAEADPKVREHAVVALSHTDWPDREDVITGIARDQQRAGGERLEAMGALGRTGSTPESLALLMDVALGPKQPVTGLSEANAKAHPVADLRSGAVLAVMTRGDQEAARRLMEAADAPGADPDLSRIVDTQIAHFRGPDISEFIYDRARRRGFLSAGEVRHLVRDPERVDRARLRDALPLIRDPETKALAEKLASGG